MYHSRPHDHPQVRSAPLWVWISGALMVLAMIGLSAAVYAEDIDTAASANASSAQDNASGAVAWMSGGVGGEARDAMRKAAPDFNVHLMFQGRRGNYLASVPYTVQHQGLEIHSGVSDGPLLYLKLPPGTYQINAELDGAWQHKRIVVSAAGHTTKASFMARGE